MSEETRIVVVDDHDTFRDPLAFMLEREPDLTGVARPRTLFEAREVLESEGLAVDVAIVDLNLPDGSGADFIRDLQRSRPRAMALVSSATSEEKYLAAGEQLLSQQEVIEALRFLVRERECHREAQH